MSKKSKQPKRKKSLNTNPSQADKLFDQMGQQIFRGNYTEAIANGERLLRYLPQQAPLRADVLTQLGIALRTNNQPILDSFQAWLEQSGLSEKTVKNHVENIDFFTEYLVYYDPLKKLDEADSDDVWMFLADWFPRKALWASVTSVKSYLASLKKFFQWMGETDRVSPETVTGVLTTLKEGRGEFLERVADYNSYPWFTQ